MNPRYYFHRLAGRLVRQVIGVDRTPVTEHDLRIIDLLAIAWAVLFGSCFTALLLIAFFGDRLLNAMFGGG